MINILSIRCSLAFAPYLSFSLAEFLTEGRITSAVVRQGGRGLILRSDGDLVIRHEDRQATFGIEEVRHYVATIQMRTEIYEVLRMQDEVVLANVGGELFLSHPQSAFWLQREAVDALAKLFARESSTEPAGDLPGLPDWLKVSTGGGRLLLSDQRTARWVLLGLDHLREFERRLDKLQSSTAAAPRRTRPTIPVKGLTVHLQSALKLCETLEGFATTRELIGFEEITPAYSLKVSACTEGIELSDSDVRVALTAREAGKWANILRDEIERTNTRQVERAGIRTVFADSADGCWVLQGGDGVFVPKGTLLGPKTLSDAPNETSAAPISKYAGDCLLILSHATGDCVALTDLESRNLGLPLDTTAGEEEEGR